MGPQGEVEQIAMMKPKGLTEHEDGLLEYLEDIIGSDRFVEAAEEAAKKVEELSDQRTEKVQHIYFYCYIAQRPAHRKRYIEPGACCM